MFYNNNNNNNKMKENEEEDWFLKQFNVEKINENIKNTIKENLQIDASCNLKRKPC